MKKTYECQKQKRKSALEWKSINVSQLMEIMGKKTFGNFRKRFKYQFLSEIRKTFYNNLEAFLEMQTPFIKKIKMIMEEPEYHEIIRWTKGNTAIEIRDQKIFEEKILPLHFRHNKMPSFIRQLNLYGFKKIRSASLQTFTHHAFEEGKGLESILSQRKKNLIEQRFEVQENVQRPRIIERSPSERPKTDQPERKEEKTIEVPKIQNTHPYIENTFVYPSPQATVWPTDMRNYFMMPQNFFLPYNCYGNWGY